MAVTRAQVHSFQELATWLNSNATELFSSVTYSDNELTAKDKDGYTAFTIGYYVSGYLGLRAYRASGNYIQSGGWNDIVSNNINIIKCDNGLIIEFQYEWNVTRGQGILISQTNNGKLAVIFSPGGEVPSSTNYRYTQLRHVALGDSTTISTTTTFTPESANQTVLVPFTTNADLTDVSYCPNAFYMPTGQYYNMGLGRFELAESTYITNGYWAVKE